jgi:tetratricopeptide (TPR) repeat protein
MSKRDDETGRGETGSAERSPPLRHGATQHNFDRAMEHHDAGRLSRAEDIYRKILAAEPDNPRALHLLGVIALQRDRNDVAEDLIARALAIEPDFAAAHSNLGLARNALGRPEDAVASYRAALAIEPDFAAAHYNCGLALEALERYQDAVASYRKALAIEPDYVEAHNNLGSAFKTLGRYEDAVASYRKALAIRPGSAEAHSNLGNALKALGRSVDAVASYRKALAIDPGSAAAHNNLGNALTELGQPQDAVASYREALAVRPDFAEAHNNLGSALRKLGRLDDAVASCMRALAVRPDYAEAHGNLANALTDLGRPRDAVASFHAALDIRPRSAQTWANLALALRALGRLEEAIAGFEKALALHAGGIEAGAAPGDRPDRQDGLDDDEARFCQGLCHLPLGHFGDGWRCYLHRESMRTAAPGFFRDELPQDLSGRRILVVRDQGLGDEIFFLRFVPALTRRGAEVSYLPDARLAGMFARAGIAGIVGDEAAAGGFDFKLAVGDLPFALGPDPIGRTPPSINLTPLAGREARLTARLAAFGPAPYVAVTWRAGTPGRDGLLYKETPAARMAAALAPLDVRVLALQRNPQNGEVAAFEDALGRPVLDLTELNADLEDMLALVGLLDDYICVSNTNVHLTAARGGACRVLAPNPPEFRWMAAGSDSPWFPGMAVYRQATDGDWGSAFAALARDLAGKFGAG